MHSRVAFLSRFGREAVRFVAGSFGLILLLFTACGGGSGPIGPVPDTLIDNPKPAAFTNLIAATFNFHASIGASTFQCKLDAAALAACASGISYAGLAAGVHTFTVVATNGGAPDPTPASYTWTIDLTPPGAPAAITGISGDGRVTLRFNAPADTDLVGYRAYRSTAPIADTATCGCLVEQVPSAGVLMEYPSKGLTPGTTYHHRVTAVDMAGNEGPASGSMSGTPKSEILISDVSVVPHSAASASDGSQFLVVWDTDINNNPLNPNYDVLGAFVHPDGYLTSAPFIIYQGAGNQQFPRVAYDSARSQFDVAWEDTRNGPVAVFVARVTRAGALLDPAGQSVVSNADTNHSPSVACADAGCMIVWEEVSATTRSLLYSRFADAVVNSPPLTITNIPNGDIPLRVKVTSSRSLFLVTWSSLADQNPYAVRLSYAGGVLDGAPVQLSNASGDQSRPLAAPVAPAGLNSSFLIVWEDNSAGSPDQNDIYGVILAPSGLPSAPIGLSVGTLGKKQLTAVSCSDDGLRGLLAWADSRGTNPRIYSLALNLVPVPAPAGPETPVSAGDFTQSRPSVSGGTGRFLISWLDYRNTVDIDNPDIDVYAHAVDQ